ncbi:baseplate J/gp47 family protein [Achromobacter sp. Marseille-Q0513]|uniref:baseplate J/gp47 family protein n=1 Tax=Achromobacter sp. Marseille-Q0513 TaxID=2829161 RepID=UPI001B9FC830|nr:baseplate J/gp47 family protein [Achromobacter sp. Marseille-Q0513]MBR8654186.1 baseplate J/gp47 family protein [Achromobacter sp. Marseille-Q0513]
MAELTPAGYKLKNQNDWFDQERNLYLSIDTEWILDPSSPDGLKVAHDAEIFSALDEVLYRAWASKDPAKAVGIDLDTISAITGTFRKPGTPSNVDLTFTGVPGSAILSESVVESVDTGQRWIVDQTFTVGPGGTVVVPVRSQLTGPIQAEPGTITRMVTTIAGVSAVTNINPATPGTEKEADSSLRIRRRLEVGQPGSNQVDSLYGVLSGTAGVRRVKVYENPTASAAVDPDLNPHGLPPHSVTILVDGGIATDLAMSIYLKKNPGVLLHGDGTVIREWVTSPTIATHQQLITFGRPIYVDVAVSIGIKNDGSLPDDVDAQIKDAIISFAAGESPSGVDGFKTTGFDIGESVPISTMYTPINQVIGKYGNSYVTSLTLDGAAANKHIAYNQLSRWLRAKITVAMS